MNTIQEALLSLICIQKQAFIWVSSISIAYTQYISLVMWPTKDEAHFGWTGRAYNKGQSDRFLFVGVSWIYKTSDVEPIMIPGIITYDDLNIQKSYPIRIAL